MLDAGSAHPPQNLKVGQGPPFSEPQLTGARRVGLSPPPESAEQARLLQMSEEGLSDPSWGRAEGNSEFRTQNSEFLIPHS